MLKLINGILLFLKYLPDLISLLFSVRDAVKKLETQKKEGDKPNPSEKK